MTNEIQTELLKQLGEMLRSISLFATEARQNHLGNPDLVSETLESIQSDLDKANKLNEKLWRNEE